MCALATGVQTCALPIYRLDFEEIGRRAAEAVERGATEVCLQGGIRSAYDGNTYLDILRAEIGRASCRERVCPYVSISEVAVSLKNKRTRLHATSTSCSIIRRCHSASPNIGRRLV